MKIGYVLDWDIIAQSSVLNKIQKKILYWESLGHEVCLFLVSYKTDSQFIPKLKNIRIFERADLSILKLSSLKTFFGRNRAFGRMLKEMRVFCPDIVYLRPGMMWYPNVSKIVSSFPTVLELNSIDEEEAKIYYPDMDIRYKIFKYGRKDLLKKCSGIVSLTDEIGKRYQSFKKKTIVISNGVSFPETAPEKVLEGINIIFVGTPGQPWQGFDQFVKMASLLPDFTFHLVGPTLSELGLEGSSNLICHGFMDAKRLGELYRCCHIGVGTLALFKKNMQEACPLKVREYVANQLFLILGYTDTDFHGKPFSLYIDNSPDNVQKNITEIKSFILDIASQRNINDPVEKKQYAVHTKEDERLRFLSDVRTTYRK